MKTFKEYVIEDNNAAKTASAVGTTNTTSHGSVENSNLGPHNIEDADVLKQVNAFVSSIGAREFIDPKQAVAELREKLSRIGLTFGEVDMPGDKGKAEAAMVQFGGRYGKTGSEQADEVTSDDGISHRKESGLKLQFEYETLKNGTSKVYAKLV